MNEKLLLNEQIINLIDFLPRNENFLRLLRKNKKKKIKKRKRKKDDTEIRLLSAKTCTTKGKPNNLNIVVKLNSFKSVKKRNRPRKIRAVFKISLR